MKNKKLIIILGIIVVILIIVLLSFGVNMQKNAMKKEEEEIKLYTVPQTEKIYVNAVVTPNSREEIFTDASKGEVETVHIANDQIIEAGALLFTYKNKNITEQIEELNSQINSLNNDKNRANLKKESGQKEINEAKNNIKKIENEKIEETLENMSIIEKNKNEIVVLQSKVASLESQITGYEDQIENIISQINSLDEKKERISEKEYFNVHSKTRGKVTINDLNIQTKPYIVIEDTTFSLEGKVSEKERVKLKEELLADILVFSTNEKNTGKILSISDSPSENKEIQSTNNSNLSYYNILLSIDNQENLINGFHVQATIKLNESEIKIPKESVFEESDGKKYILKVEDKKLKKCEVFLENVSDTEFLVISGLNEGEKIAEKYDKLKVGKAIE